MSEIAAKNGAGAYPAAPRGRGAGWGNFEYERKCLAADKANAPYSEENSGIKYTVTPDGLKTEIGGPIFDVVENGIPVLFRFAAVRVPIVEAGE